MTSSTLPMPVAVVTGGTQGVGLAAAQWFLVPGYGVALWDTGVTALPATEKALNDPERVLALPCDAPIDNQVQAAT